MKQGMVQSVETFVAGEAPLETAPVGATTIAFEDAGDFDEEGGQVNINGVILSYDSADLEEEVEAIHLSAPLAFEVTVQDMVLVHPEASETIAVVTDQDGTIEAVVPHALRAFFPEGPRDPEAGEMVLIADDEYGRPTIQNVEGRSPEMDARFVSNADELLLENQRYLGDVLSQNEAAITNAEGRLSTAEGRIVDAFDEIELKPDQAYVDAAKQQAIDAAAIDAQTKADAARDAAITDAQDAIDAAEATLQQAILDGDAAAIADAEAKIAVAKAAAIDAAADDAAAKAAAAQSAAEQAAQEALTQAQTDLEDAIASGDAAAIADAEAKIATAKQEAITAAANDATAKAGEAMQKANAALTAAQSAQATADNAIRTYYSETPPWASNTSQPDDVLGDMWYQDSTGQAYRWNGTSWKVIQDASIGEALAAAQGAQTTADGKITAYYQPNEPLEGDEGDLWFDTDDDSSVHRRTGGQWLALLDPKALADEAESNAKAFATTRTDGLAKTLWSTSLPGTTTAPQDSVWYQVDGDGKIIAVFTQTAAGPAGNTWVARPITSEAIDNLDVGKLTASSGTVNDLVANTFAAKLADIIEANIGNLTVTGDTHLEDLVAQTIAGDTASFMELTVDQILAGFLQAQWIITETGAIIAGSPDGARVEIRHDGVRVYVIGPNGEPYEAVSMVNGEISFGVMGQDGTRLGGIASDGSVSGVRGSFSNDINIKGLPLTGQLGGGTIPGHLDNLPRGVIQRNFKSTPESSIVTGVERLYLRLNATLYPGRLYRLNAWMRASLAAEGGALTLAMRWSTTGPASLSSPQVPGTSTYSFPNASANHRIVGQAESFIEVDVVTKARFVLTYKGDYGATPSASLTNFYIEDVGPSTPITGGDDEGGADTTLYRSTWRATASRNYTKAGTTVPDQDGEINQWYWGGVPTDRRPAAWIYGGGAFEADDPLEMGKTLDQALAGANIVRVEVYIRNKLWYGGVEHGRIVVGTLSSSTLPSTGLFEGQLRIDDLGSGESARFDVPTSWFTNGANKGITMGDKDGVTTLGGQGTVELHSGRFHGIDDSDPPLLIVTYSR